MADDANLQYQIGNLESRVRFLEGRREHHAQSLEHIVGALTAIEKLIRQYGERLRQLELRNGDYTYIGME